MKKFNTAVIGVGSLGQHHARVMSTHPMSELTFIVDADVTRAETIAKPLKENVNISVDYKDIIGKVDCAVIAVPTPYHYAIAKDLLSAGVHCLVEKPFTSTLKEADELIEIAKAKNLVLQVGHIERFNPAFIAATPYIKNPNFIEVNRLGPYDPRTAHIGVVMDLMVHDLDIILSLVKSPVVSVEAHGSKVLSDYEDIVKARLKFENGCVADVSTSRVSLDRYRRMRVFQPDSYVSIDFGGKAFKVCRKKQEVAKAASLADMEIIKPEVSAGEPLFFEADNFLNCIKNGSRPVVSGTEGRAAIELAGRVLESMVLF